uniref:Uncharacterized protein n=1 Tax=Tetranychus urticae TaxID=32264 RepID=T1JWV4_TETUR
MMKMDGHKFIATVINVAVLWSTLEAAPLSGEKTSLIAKEKLENGKSLQLNETKTSASFDSFRVSTPETNRDGTLLLDSYHDFRSNHHHPHHGHNYGHGYGHYGHHYPHHYGTRDDFYHHGHHYNYPNHHHEIHRSHSYPSDEPEVNSDRVDSVDNGEEITDPVVDEPVSSDSPTNGELVVDPETEENPEALDEPSVTENPESDVEEIPIEDIPGEPVNGEMVSGNLRVPRTSHGYDHRYHDNSFSNSYDHRYPILSHLPPTHFKCSHVRHSGYSPNVEARCQVILPGNRSGKWEILHFLHKSSPQKSNAVIYLDHGETITMAIITQEATTLNEKSEIFLNLLTPELNMNICILSFFINQNYCYL